MLETRNNASLGFCKPKFFGDSILPIRTSFHSCRNWVFLYCWEMAAENASRPKSTLASQTGRQKPRAQKNFALAKPAWAKPALANSTRAKPVTAKPAPEAWIGRQRSAAFWSNSPTPVGRKLARLLLAADLSVPALARAIDWRVSRLYDLAAGKSPMTPNLALRLARFFGNDAKAWLVCGLDEALAAERARAADEIDRIVPLAANSALHPALAGRTRAERANIKS